MFCSFFSQSAEMLMTESGCRLDHPAAAKFRQHVMDADWIKADHDLQELKPLLENSQSLLVNTQKTNPEKPRTNPILILRK